MPTKEDLKYFQAMPLDIKVAMTKTRIREWVTHFGVTGTYISFSGGKDSTVLLHLVRELYPDIEAVFVNTGLEFPEIQSFVKSFNNTTILRPEMTFNEVVKKYGYPFVSKQVSHAVDIARRHPEGKVMKNMFSEEKRGPFAMRKWLPLVNSDFIISEKCCNVMKKNPTHKFEKETGKVPFVATMAEESKLRENDWIHNSCNSFEGKKQISKPMSFWTESDVLQYIKENNIKIASVYGDIIPEDKQLTFNECVDCPKYCTSGEHRTGCVFCGYGAHLEKESRFLRLKQTHPKQYRYCMDGGEYDIDGIWKPNSKGLGMAHVIDELNKLYSKNGKAFIEY